MGAQIVQVEYAKDVLLDTILMALIVMYVKETVLPVNQPVIVTVVLMATTNQMLDNVCLVILAALHVHYQAVLIVLQDTLQLKDFVTIIVKQVFVEIVQLMETLVLFVIQDIIYPMGIVILVL